ncbi:hypothetical protein GN156_03380 [bacterium LRH843]|nr:hypothetical protein [bacterium LRH843]
MVKYIKKWLKFTKTFPYIRMKFRGRATLTIVEDLSKKCDTEAEKLLYKELTAHSYYPTPHHWLHGIKINLALIPYRLALIETQAGLNEKRIERILKKHRWHVIFYDAKQLIQDEQPFVSLVSQYAPTQTKNVSTSL